jgi:hypothetical protein
MKKSGNKKAYEGYPRYPADQDITRAKNNNGKLPYGDVTPPPPEYNDTIDERDDETAIVPGTDADVTAEDLRLLEAAEQNMDTMDSSNLQHSALDDADMDGEPLNEEGSISMDMAGTDLDVPGSAADDGNENIGEEDEENNYYSLGGDIHESQEENKGE